MKTIQEQIEERAIKFCNDDLGLSLKGIVKHGEQTRVTYKAGANFALDLANKWYDVKECLPEKTGYYNVKLKSQLKQPVTQIFRVGLFDATRKCFAGGKKLNELIIAWKPIELK